MIFLVQFHLFREQFEEPCYIIFVKYVYFMRFPAQIYLRVDSYPQI
jgi:hypothetical protein